MPQKSIVIKREKRRGKTEQVNKKWTLKKNLLEP